MENKYFLGVFLVSVLLILENLLLIMNIFGLMEISLLFILKTVASVETDESVTLRK